MPSLVKASPECYLFNFRLRVSVDRLIGGSMAAKKKNLSDDEAEQEFERIAQEASEKASLVKCDAETYRSGLRGMIDRLQIDLAAAGA